MISTDTEIKSLLVLNGIIRLLTQVN